MPPKTKFTKEQIVRTALEITKKQGIDAVTPQSIAKHLKSSVQPLYSWFENIGKIREAVISEATKEYDKFLLTEDPRYNRFKAFGMNYLRFAKEQPHLYKLLFMTERQKDVGIAEASLDRNKKHIVNVVKELHDLTDEQAHDLYIKTWIFCHGMAAFIVTKTVKLDDNDVSEMGTQAFSSILRDIKSKNV